MSTSTQPDLDPPESPGSGATSLSVKVLLGLGAGLVLGVFLSPAESGATARIVAWIEPVGALWVNAIRMTVVPLVVTLLVAGIAGAGMGTAARVGGRSLAWFALLVGLSVAVAWLCAPPLLRLLGAESAQVAEVAASAVATEVTLPPFRDWVVGLEEQLQHVPYLVHGGFVEAGFGVRRREPRLVEEFVLLSQAEPHGDPEVDHHLP